MTSVPLVVGLTVTAVLCAVSWLQVRHLPEPADGPDEGKRLYRSLGVRWYVPTTLLALALTWWTHDQPQIWAWIVWASVALVLVAVDLATTWLPNRLMHPMLGLLAIALAAPWLAGGTVQWLTVVLGSAAAGGFFWLVWRFSQAFGFGDVRLAFGVGALAGAHGWSFWWTSLMAGTCWAPSSASRSRCGADIVLMHWGRCSPTARPCGQAHGSRWP